MVQELNKTMTRCIKGSIKALATLLKLPQIGIFRMQTVRECETPGCSTDCLGFPSFLAQGNTVHRRTHAQHPGPCLLWDILAFGDFQVRREGKANERRGCMSRRCVIKNKLTVKRKKKRVLGFVFLLWVRRMEKEKQDRDEEKGK